MTRTPSFLVGVSAAPAALRTPARPGIALSVGEVNVIPLIGRAGGRGLSLRMGRGAGERPGTHPFFDLSYRAVQPERMCPTYTRTSVG